MYARYTEFLRDLMLNEHTRPALDKALSTYPLYEPVSKNEYIPNIIPTREELNEKLLNAYKYREIGFETVGRFLDELEIAMHEIMPYYNQIFFTQDQDFNIIYNVDYVKQTDIERENTTSANSTGNTSSNTTSTSDTTNTSNSNSSHEETNSANGKSVGSKTPQDSLSITGAAIDSIPYADEVDWSKNDGRAEGSTTSDSTFASDSESKVTSSGETSNTHEGEMKGSEGITEKTTGNFGVVSAQDLIAKYRDTILNTVQMIINDRRIKELFMNVY